VYLKYIFLGLDLMSSLLYCISNSTVTFRNHNVMGDCRLLLKIIMYTFSFARQPSRAVPPYHCSLQKGGGGHIGIQEVGTYICSLLYTIHWAPGHVFFMVLCSCKCGRGASDHLGWLKNHPPALHHPPWNLLL
jgi:hypothetical protein